MAEEVLDIEGNIAQGITDSHSCQGLNRSAKASGSTGSSDGESKRKLEDKGGGGWAPPEATKKQKVSLGFSRSLLQAKSQKKTAGPTPISIKLGTQKPKDPEPSLKKASASVAEMFNQDSDEEEMPPEARMRMRNIGRDTPTSAGPNSFGKTRQGFCDIKKVFERNLKKQMDDVTKK